MKENINLSKGSLGARYVAVLPEVSKFYYLLFDRLYRVLDHEFKFSDPFTMFLTALPRKEDASLRIEEEVTLIYGGIRRQRELLEDTTMQTWNYLDKHWRFLDNYDLSSASAVVGSVLYQKFSQGEYKLKDISSSSGSLKHYFAPILEPQASTKEATAGQKAEYEILSNYFSIEDDRYLSLPLIQFGWFDGVIHIVYKKQDHEKLLKDTESNTDNDFNLAKIGDIIKSFSNEYESLLLSWALEGISVLVLFDFSIVLNDTFYQKINSNPILLDLQYQKYYRKHYPYFKERIDQNEKIPKLVISQYRKIAILSIMIDSYAHNISAHSLTALEWWFKQRAEIYREGREAVNQFPGEPLPIVDPEKKTELASEIQPLLRFLLDKGAFWTGLTREESFGGKISSLYSVLWYDFVNNPLYLGTIAFSEGILRININLTVLEVQKVYEGGYKFKKRIKKQNGVLLDGNFASINLSFINPNTENNPKHISDFIKRGEKFEAFRQELTDYKAFFPGGVVGRHAFFTILENELRNVKHYTPEQRKNMQEDGLTLNLSIEQDSYQIQRKDVLRATSSEYYKIGVWIKHPVKITHDLLIDRLSRLAEDIIMEESYRPRLGGSFQDKVCAAMLFNNTFSSVHNQASERDRRYYPWLKTGSSRIVEENAEMVEDLELSWRRMDPIKEKPQNVQALPKEGQAKWEMERMELEKSRQQFEEEFESYEGFYKKFFHIWKGEDIHSLDVTSNEDKKWENISRFRFIINPPENKVAFQNVRRRGVLRILTKECADLAEAYQEWLDIWSKTNKIQMISFAVWKADGSAQFDPVVHLIAEGKSIRLLNSDQLEEEDPTKLAAYRDAEKTERQIIPLAHGTGLDKGGGGYCRIRSHGVFVQYFLNSSIQKNNEGFDLAKIQIKDPELIAELFEVLSTRICIFDNRIAKRISTAQQKTYKDRMACTIHEEDLELWQLEKKRNLLNYHFLVVHLSFIEAFRKKNGGKKYNEDNIESFIREEILQGNEAPENFILVITTGRGRTQWWEGLKKGETDYPTFTTFRPVETLIAAVENSISISDDIELKYRLVKVLFGS